MEAVSFTTWRGSPGSSAAGWKTAQEILWAEVDRGNPAVSPRRRIAMALRILEDVAGTQISRNKLERRFDPLPACDTEVWVGDLHPLGDTQPVNAVVDYGAGKPGGVPPRSAAHEYALVDPISDRAGDAQNGALPRTATNEAGA